MKSLKIFETENHFNTYYPNGEVPSNDVVFIKETDTVVMSTNNVTKSFTVYNAVVGGGGASPEEIEELQNIIAQKEEEIANLNTTIADKEDMIVSLNESITDKEVEIESLKSENASKDNEIETLNSVITDKEAEITLKESEIEILNSTIENGFNELKQVLQLKGYTIPDNYSMSDLINIVNNIEQHNVRYNEDTKTLYVDSVM